MACLRPHTRLAALALLMALAACGPAPDPFAKGQLCAPSTESCPDRTTIRRETSGANVLDLTIRNRGPRATISIDVETTGPAPTFDTAANAADTDAGLPTRRGLFPVNYSLEPDDEIEDRFVPSELGTRNVLDLRIRCTPCPSCTEACDVVVDWVAMSRRLACENDDDCRRDWSCDRQEGRCVACQSDDDCRPDQSCDRASGRCLPPAERGCAHGGGLPLPVGLVLAVGLAAALLRRRSSARTVRTLLTAATIAAALCTLPEDAGAESPHSELSLGIGPRFVTGEAASSVHRGLGLEIAESLRWRSIGATAWLQTSYFLTSQESPPLSRSLQIFGFGLGPTVHHEFGRISVGGTVGYQRVGFASNSLVRQIGMRSNYHAVGARATGTYHLPPIFFGIGTGWFAIFDAPASLLDFNVRIGISTK